MTNQPFCKVKMISPAIKDIIEYLEYAIKEDDWDSVQEALDIIREEFIDDENLDEEDF